MRLMVLTTGLLLFGVIGTATWLSGPAAVEVHAKACAMARANREAGEIGFRFVADRFPYSAEAFEARRALAAMALPTAAGGERSDAGRALRDRIWLPAAPHAGPLLLAAGAGLAAAAAFARPRSRVRGRAFLTLLIVAGATATTQTEGGLSALESIDRNLPVQIFAAFPRTILAALAVSLALACARPASARRAGVAAGRASAAP